MDQGNQASPKPVYNPLEVMQPGEQVICEIRRHPIGLFGIYAIAGLLLATTISAAILAPIYLTFLTADQKTGILLGAGLVIFLVIILTYIAVYVYQANRWILTSDSITQIIQNSLFDRHASQLSLEKLEDVSSDQHSLIQQLFGFGDITIETAGAEPGKFIIDYCPDPDGYARRIIAAQEAFMARRNTETVTLAANMVANPGLAVNPPAPVDPNNLPPVSGQPPAAAPMA